MRVASLLSASRSAWATPSVPPEVSTSDAWASRRVTPAHARARQSAMAHGRSERSLALQAGVAGVWQGVAGGGRRVAGGRL